jgi:predicted small integral membrane protein
MAILAIFLALVLPLVWMPWSWQLVAVLLVIASFTYAAIVWGLATYTQSTPAQEIRLYEKLLMRAGGDRALVDRLIAYEQQQKPTANRLQLLQNALERWYRDRR